MKHASIIRAMYSMTDEQLRRLADADGFHPVSCEACLMGVAGGRTRLGYDAIHFQLTGEPSRMPRAEHRFMGLCERISGTVFEDAPESVARAINRVAREILAGRKLAVAQQERVSV